MNIWYKSTIIVHTKYHVEPENLGGGGGGGGGAPPPHAPKAPPPPGVYTHVFRGNGNGNGNLCPLRMRTMRGGGWVERPLPD